MLPVSVVSIHWKANYQRSACDMYTVSLMKFCHLQMDNISPWNSVLIMTIVLHYEVVSMVSIFFIKFCPTDNIWRRTICWLWNTIIRHPWKQYSIKLFQIKNLTQACSIHISKFILLKVKSFYKASFGISIKFNIHELQGFL